jgi:hypothetical protein
MSDVPLPLRGRNSRPRPTMIGHLKKEPKADDDGNQPGWPDLPDSEDEHRR